MVRRAGQHGGVGVGAELVVDPLPDALEPRAERPHRTAATRAATATDGQDGLFHVPGGVLTRRIGGSAPRSRR